MDELLREIEGYCERVGCRETTFGTYAVGDGKFVKRLRRGGQCLPRTADAARAYMAAHPARALKPQRGEDAA